MTSMDEELAVLLALDALEADEQADAELRLGTFGSEALGASAALAERVATAPPEDLRAGVLAAALARRPAGPAVDDVTPCTPGEAYERTIDEFLDLLRSLTQEDWERPAHGDHGRVRDVVAHLGGIEELVLRWLDPADDVPEILDHVEATRQVVADLADAPISKVIGRWYLAARAVAAAASRADRNRLITFHDGQLTPKVLVVVRVFELWAHQTDIARATGRPLPELDPERMAIMSQMLMSLVPFALAYRDAAQPGRTARFVLTGSAGGTYTVPLSPGGEVGEPDVTIVAGVVDLCRLASRRLTPAELGATVEGDAELGGLVLAGLDAFARD